MLRRLLGTVLVLGALAGCSSRMGECQSDGDCQRFGEQAVCEATTKQCFVRGSGADAGVVEPEVDGGTCQFQCAEFEACTATGCVSRYAAVSFVTPPQGAVFDGGTATVTLTARLETKPAYAATTTFPSTLNFLVGPANGGPSGELGSITAAGDGTYSVEWTPPAVELDYVFTAAYPAPNGPFGTVGVRVDNVGPTFEVVLPTPPAPAPADGFTYTQPGAPPAWPRDQTVLLQVRSSATDVDPTSFAVTVRGVNGGADHPALTFTDCTGAAFCKQANVDLWRPGLHAFSGGFAVEVTGRDRVGNPGTRTGAASIPVTRWKWAFDGQAGPIRASPAIGEKGMVYVATSNTNGQVFALTQDGTRKWAQPLGAVVGTPAVGGVRSDDEYLYVGSTDSAGAARLYALQGSSGAVVERCPDTTAGLGGNQLESAVGVGTSTTDLGSRVETAVAIYNSSTSAARMVALRPDALLGDRCINLSGPGGTPIPPTTVGNALVIAGDTFFYGTSDRRLASYVINTNAPRANWPLGTTQIARGLALVDDQVYGTGAATDDPAAGGLFNAPQTVPAGTTSVTYLYPSATPASRVFNLALGKGRVAYFGAETGTSASLVRSDLATPTTPLLAVSAVAALRAAPVLGAGGLLYTVNADGDVAAWTSDALVQRWRLELETNPLEASPTLDCVRNAAGVQQAGSPLGVLYVPAGTRLHAFLVDSPRMDVEAPWPRFQHDARNSGNPATPITSCQ